MTIEEKSIDFVGDIIDHEIALLERVSFACGAKWMQSELIEKAVEQFKHQKEEIGISWSDDYEIRFRKAMEE